LIKTLVQIFFFSPTPRVHHKQARSAPGSISKTLRCYDFVVKMVLWISRIRESLMVTPPFKKPMDAQTHTNHNPEKSPPTSRRVEGFVSLSYTPSNSSEDAQQ